MADSSSSISFAPDAFGPPEIQPEELITRKKLGEGCFGVVYEGECRGKTVAIKILKNQKLTDKALNEFKNEVECASRVHHPNVVLFMGACMIPGNMTLVTEFMSLGTLEHVLYDKNRTYSSFQLMKMAKDAAQGMSWLHGSNPKIVHRDLKPANLMLDSHGTVKVGDFGLSCVKPESQIKDEGRPVGSPIWMSPEVLLMKNYDEKSDVYAYSLILWEMLAKKQPYAHVQTFSQLKREVCIEKKRPELDPKWPDSLKNLLNLCWHHDPEIRPSFNDIIRHLDEVLIDFCVEDPIGNRIWKQDFLGQLTVPWDDFIVAFYRDLKLGLLNNEDMSVKALQHLIGTQHHDTSLKDRPYVVESQNWGLFLENFGPIEVGVNIGAKCEELLRCPWFHGTLTKEEAEQRLQTESNGTFLVRFSSGGAGFTISKRTVDGKISHQRIDKDENRLLSVKIARSGGVREAIGNKADLVDFINTVRGTLNLLKDCSGSHYQAIFSPIVSAYE